MAKKTSKKTSAKPKSNKETSYAIQYLSSNMKMSNAEISKELGIPLSEVEKTLGEPVAQEAPKTQSKSHNLMIRKTSAKGTNNVSIMTEAASQYNDEVKKNQTPKRKSVKDCIYQPRKNGS